MTPTRPHRGPPHLRPLHCAALVPGGTVCFTCSKSSTSGRSTRRLEDRTTSRKTKTLNKMAAVRYSIEVLFFHTAASPATLPAIYLHSFLAPSDPAPCLARWGASAASADLVPWFRPNARTPQRRPEGWGLEVLPFATFLLHEREIPTAQGAHFTG